MKDLILLKDVNYFGRIIRRGSTFKKADADWYVLWENSGGIIMHCPAIKLHYTSVDCEYFIEQYGVDAVRQEERASGYGDGGWLPVK